MKNNDKAYLWGIIGFLVGVVATILFTSNAVNNQKTGALRMMGMRINTEKSGVMTNMDKHFIEEMIPHHEGAIEMAELALKQSKRPEIKTLSENIIKSQKEEIRLMKSWYKDWFGTDVLEEQEQTMGMGRGMMHGGMMGDKADTDSLKNANDFDKAFIEEMIPHHQMAIMMANMLAQGTNRQEMKTLAQNIIDAQTSEINDMRGWYKTWGY